jgi:hypothetical protein
MNRRKMTLNEEINQMKKLFGHMNMPLLIREAISGGGGGIVKPLALSAIDSGSYLAKYVGTQVSKEIEDAIVLAARNSDAVTQALGKQAKTFADLEIAYPGKSKSDVALKVIGLIEMTAAKNLMFNLSEKLGPVNLNNLKINMTKLVAPEVQSLKTSLSDLETVTLKQLTDPTTADAAAILFPATMTKIKGIIEGISESSMPAATKKALLETLDGIDAQANALTTKIAANEVADNIPTTTTVKEVLTSDWTNIKTTLSEFGVSVTDNMKVVMSDFFDSIDNTLLKKMEDDMELAFGPGKVPLEDNAWYGAYKYDFSSQGSNGKNYSNAGRIWDEVVPRAGRTGDYWFDRIPKITKGVVIILVAMGLYAYFSSGEAKKDFKDTIKEISNYATTADPADVNCVQTIVGYNGLTDDQKTYVGNNVGCLYSDENANPKCTGFATVNGKLEIAFGSCVETHVVEKGGLRGSRTSGDCRGGSNTTTKKYSCVNNNCVEDVNGTYMESTCGGACGGSNTTTKKYACVNNNCVEDVNGTYDEPNCGGACGGSNVTPAYSNDEEGFNNWVKANKYKNTDWSNGKWYKDNGVDKQAEYKDGTWQEEIK